MKASIKSQWTYIGIALVMLLGKGIWTILNFSDPLIDHSLNSWPMMMGIAAGGYLALLLCDRSGFPDIWEYSIPNSKRIVMPMLVGALFAGVQIIIVTAQGLEIPMIPFPISIPVYTSVGILSELYFHFIPLVFGVWLISTILLRERAEEQIFWLMALALSLWEPVLQIMTMMQMGIITEIMAGAVPFALVFAANLVPVIFIRRYGLLSAVTWRLTNYLIWHIIWGGFFM